MLDQNSDFDWNDWRQGYEKANRDGLETENEKKKKTKRLMKDYWGWSFDCSPGPLDRPVVASDANDSRDRGSRGIRGEIQKISTVAFACEMETMLGGRVESKTGRTRPVNSSEQTPQTKGERRYREQGDWEMFMMVPLSLCQRLQNRDWRALMGLSLACLVVISHVFACRQDSQVHVPCQAWQIR